MDQFVSIIGGAFLGACLSTIFVLFFERLRNPRLFLDVGEPAEGNFPNEGRCKWLHMRVANQNMCKVIRRVFLLDRHPAYACYALVSFYDISAKAIHRKPMLARWVETPEPVSVISHNHEVAHIPDPAKAIRHYTISPGTSATIDIAFRAERDSTAFGWNNESYWHNWRNKEFRLPKRPLLYVQVRVLTAGHVFEKFFALRNDAYDLFGLMETPINTSLDDLKKVSEKSTSDRETSISALTGW
jgi:hypothetical protein